MRRTIAYGSFLVAIAIGSGCAITDYGIIHDNDQVRAGGPGGGPIVNTNGPAHHYESSQVATFWPDGTDELINFVDQKADGTATLTTYRNYNRGFEGPTFHTDLYCNTDWSGCSVFTAPDDNDGNLFDGRTNINCPATRNLSILLSTGRYYGECGRQRAKFSIDQRVTALNSAVMAQRHGRSGLLWRSSPNGTTLRARNAATGLTHFIPLFGARLEYFVDEGGRLATLGLDHPMLGTAFTNLASMLQGPLNSEALTVTLEHNGVTADFTMAGGANPIVRETVRHNARRL
jgi:hypothetical protein